MTIVQHQRDSLRLARPAWDHAGPNSSTSAETKNQALTRVTEKLDSLNQEQIVELINYTVQCIATEEGIPPKR